MHFSMLFSDIITKEKDFNLAGDGDMCLAIERKENRDRVTGAIEADRLDGLSDKGRRA